MENRIVKSARYVQSTGRPDVSLEQFESGLPLEIVTLLDVLSRIEVRRQKRLYENRKAVI